MRYKRLAARAFACCIIGVLAACGASSTATNTSPQGIVGTYTLTAVNGSALPVTVTGATVISGSLTLNADGTYAEARSIQYTQGTPATSQTATGAYTESDGSVALHLATGTTYTSGTTDGTSLSFVEVGILYRYTR